MGKSSQRNSAIDLLKVASIYVIILHHYALYGGWHFAPGFALNKLSAQTLLIGGKLGVDIFVMITGYFLIKSHAKVRSLVSVWLDTTLICLLMYLVVVGLHLTTVRFSITGLIESLFPVLFVRYWFVTAYTLLFMVIPLLNAWFNRISSKGQLKVLGVMFGVLAIVPLFYYEKGMTFNFPIWFVFLYLVGAFLRLNQKQINQIASRKIWGWLVGLVLVSIGINAGLQVVLAGNGFLARLLRVLGWTENIFYTRDASPLMLLLAVAIFALVMRVHMSTKPGLQFLSRAAFGVYLLQSAPYFSTGYLWPTLVNARRFSGGALIIGYGILVALAIFIIGALIFACIMPIRQACLHALTKPMARVQNWFNTIQ